MSTFPPARPHKSNHPTPPHVTGERGPVSTGKGGIPQSLKTKAAGIVNAPGKEKTNAEF